jgi:2-amino-4-hydroxy-6-hydroxymethyldihydropteridine diphosphokinase
MVFSYIGFGSNCGDREDHIRGALQMLIRSPSMEVLTFSSLYETEPAEGVGGGWFLNGVVQVRTLLEPRELLTLLQAIEEKLGRDTKNRGGPRTIDLDILLYGDHVVKEPLLTIPHPKLAGRPFVLVPLLEIDPSLQHPVQRRSLHQLQLEIQNPSTVRFFKKMNFEKACPVENCS